MVYDNVVSLIYVHVLLKLKCTRIFGIKHDRPAAKKKLCYNSLSNQGSQSEMTKLFH